MRSVRHLAVFGALFVLTSWGCEREKPAAPTAPDHGDPEMHAPAASAPSSSYDLETTEPTPIPEVTISPDPVASTQPAADPQSSTSQPDVPAFTPLTDAHPGEFARYRDMKGQTLRYEIVSVDVDHVISRLTIVDSAGHPFAQPTTRDDRRDSDPLDTQASRVKAQRTMHDERIQAAGKTWNAMRYEDRWVDETIQYTRRSWVSRNVPVFGLLRMELEGDGRLEAKIELIDSGVNSH